MHVWSPLDGIYIIAELIPYVPVHYTSPHTPLRVCISVLSSFVYLLPLRLPSFPFMAHSKIGALLMCIIMSVNKI